MKKFKQCAYTLLIILTCVVASPVIFKQIWETSAEKKEESSSLMSDIDITKGFPITTADEPEMIETTATTAAETTSAQSETKTTTAKPKTTTSSKTDKKDSTTTAATTETTKKADNTTSASTTTVTFVKTTNKPKSTTTAAETTKASSTTTANKTGSGEYEFVKGSASYFDDVLFIGDSRTVGIKEYGKLKNADYFCEVGLSSGTARREAENGRIANMLRSKHYGKVYIMLGINEVGNNYEWTMNDFNKLIASIQKISPDSLIVLEANLHVTAGAETSTINNKRLNHLNGLLKGLADNKKIFYIDVNPIFDDENGNLRSDCASDGIHVYAKHYQSWSDWLCLYTIQEK